MNFTPTPLDGSFQINLTPYNDERGWFARTYCKNEFAQIGHEAEWVQLNHSFTRDRGTIRGMHYQVAPHSEIKLVRCVQGAVYDVIIDIRNGSSTFLKWFGVELSSQKRNMLYIPAGFAHGFQTLTNDAELIYHHSEFYVPGVEGGLRYDDPKLKIHWPLPVSNISSRDEEHPFIDSNFKGI